MRRLIYKLSATRSHVGIVLRNDMNGGKPKQFYMPAKISLTVLDRSKYSDEQIRAKFLNGKVNSDSETVEAVKVNSLNTGPNSNYGREVLSLCDKLDEVVKSRSTCKDFISTKTPETCRSDVFALEEKELARFFNQLEAFDVKTELSQGLTRELPEQAQDRARV